jgi:ribosomal protein L37E
VAKKKKVLKERICKYYGHASLVKDVRKKTCSNCGQNVDNPRRIGYAKIRIKRVSSQ